MNLKAILLTLSSLISLLNPLKLSSPASSPQTSPKIGIEEKQELSIPKLNYESIFTSAHGWIKDLPKNQTISVITTGDVIPARSVNWKMIHYNDFTHPFAKTYDFLKDADLTLINLEAPLTQNCPLTNEGMVFCGNQRFIEGLKFADIDVVNLANNHSLNYGTQGLCQTIELLSKNNILVSGLPQNFICPSSPSLPSEPSPLTIKKLKGTTFGFLGFNLLDLSAQSTQLTQSIRSAKNQVDFLIVSCHWGAEYVRFPAPETTKLAHLMIDNGADLIVGNHPHWYQPIGVYKEKLIVYAHGNFIFDQEWSRETKTGIVGKYLIFEGRLVDAQFFPIFIHDYSQPYFLEGEEKERVLEDLKRISTIPSKNWNSRL